MIKHRQRDTFLNGEGDAWFERNSEILAGEAEHRAATDPIVMAVECLRKKPSRIMEVGASNGWRLAALRRITGAECIGVDPSEQAVAEARRCYPAITMHRGTADALPCEDGAVELVILGFCLYLCDREDLFRIAAECDRILADGGKLMIYDFFSTIPYRNPYAHFPDIYSYKMDYARMFRWNPAYRLIEHRLTDHAGLSGNDPNDRLAFSVLVKDIRGAYIENPYAG